MLIGWTMMTTSPSQNTPNTFLSFTLQATWDADSNTTQFLVAQYAVKKLSNEYLHDQVRTIIAALYAKGFVVTAITGDGASENRSLFKTLGTLTVRDLIAKGVFPQDWLAKRLCPCTFQCLFIILAYQ